MKVQAVRKIRIAKRRTQRLKRAIAAIGTCLMLAGRAAAAAEQQAADILITGGTEIVDIRKTAMS